MKNKTSAFIGIFLILIGVVLLLRDYIDLDINKYTVRSYGLLFLGIAGFLLNLQRKPRRGMFVFPFLGLIGLYYTLGELDILSTTRGMTLSAFTIAFGLAHYPAYIFGSIRSLNKLIVGNIVLLVGLIFLSYELEYISTRLFVTIIDDYWPVALILVGVGFIINSIIQRRSTNGPVSSKELQHHP